MTERQMSLAEALLDPRIGVRGRLAKIAGVIDWAPLEGLAKRVHPGETGRPPFDGLAMLKALYLQALYDLSDPGLEEALIDRVSFRLFCGFALDQVTPDETTLCRFRNKAAEAGVLEAAFAEVNRQLDGKGLVVRKGTLVDATIIAAASHRPTWTPVQNRAWSASRLQASRARAARATLGIACMWALTRVRA